MSMKRLACAGVAGWAIVAACSGCSSVAVMHSTHEEEVQKLYVGEPRAEVRQHLGAPAASEALANGWSEDRHELRLRDDDAALYAITDVLTLGTLSMADGLSGRPRDPIYRISVVYGRDERLVCARATRLSRENYLYKHTLPPDSVVAGRCPS